MPEITNKSEEQKVAEAEVDSFRKDLGPFVVAAETTRMAMVFTDAKEPGHPIIFANDAFLSLTGYDRKEVLGHKFNFLMARGADPKTLAQVETAFEGSTDHGSEIRYRRRSRAGRSMRSCSQARQHGFAPLVRPMRRPARGGAVIDAGLSRPKNEPPTGADQPGGASAGALSSTVSSHRVDQGHRARLQKRGRLVYRSRTHEMRGASVPTRGT
jgi:PAS domain S-box-containing protein